LRNFLRPIAVNGAYDLELLVRGNALLDALMGAVHTWHFWDIELNSPNVS
jgi:hypothetical protein